MEIIASAIFSRSSFTFALSRMIPFYLDVAALSIEQIYKHALVYRLLNPLNFVAIKMGRRQGARRAHI
jgi:hypothetical protein